MTAHKPTLSFEFFPPKTDEAATQLWQELPELTALGPKYITITYGAGGSTKDWTLETAIRAHKETGLPVGSHLTFLTTPKDELNDYLEKLWAGDIKHIVALRGDVPRGKTFDDFKGDQYYKDTPDFIRAIKSLHDFEISVAAYPEKHPDAPSLEHDLQTLKAKCEAGAARAITQFFFDNEVFYRFVEKAQAAGITTPICPGLVPIHFFANTVKFAEKCEASVPAWLHEKFDGLEPHSTEAYKVAEDVLTEQMFDLAKNGVPHIHFYSMNKALITKSACQAIGY